MPELVESVVVLWEVVVRVGSYNLQIKSENCIRMCCDVWKELGAPASAEDKADQDPMVSFDAARLWSAFAYLGSSTNAVMIDEYLCLWITKLNDLPSVHAFTDPS